MKTIQLYLLLFVPVFLMAVSLPSRPTQIIQPGVYQLRLNVSIKVIVKCRIEVIQYSPCIFTAAPGWGSDSLTFPTRTVFKAIEFWVNDDKVTVPSSCYADLTNPVRANLTFAEHGYCLVIEGADGASSYNAKVDFNKTLVFHRTVHDGEDPAVWEETTYHIDTRPGY